MADLRAAERGVIERTIRGVLKLSGPAEEAIFESMDWSPGLYVEVVDQLVADGVLLRLPSDALPGEWRLALVEERVAFCVRRGCRMIHQVAGSLGSTEGTEGINLMIAVTQAIKRMAYKGELFRVDGELHLAQLPGLIG